MRALNPAYVAELIERVNRAPFVRHLTMRLAAIEPNRSVIEVAAGEQHLQPFGIVHGGVLATLIDTATFWAVFLDLPDGAGLVNVDLKLNYLEPAKPGPLRAEGRCIRAGRSISYAEAHVTGDDGTLFAHGTSTLMALPGKGFRLATPKFLET